MIDLGEFEGKKVVGTTVALRKAGDGLSKALGIDPQILHQGDRIQVLLDVVVGPVGFIPVKDAAGLVSRKHDLIAETAVIVDDDSLRERIADMNEQLRRQAEAKKGIQRLPTPEELEAAHREGGHDAAPVPGCPMCADAIDGSPDLPPLGDPPPPTPIAEGRRNRNRPSRPKRSEAPPPGDADAPPADEG